jgi:glucuronate isomerase
MPPLQPHPDRLFPSDPTQRAIARGLYGQTRDLPLICPHGHVDPALFARDEPFPDPATLLVVPDHYLLRMLYSQGVALEDLGVPSRDGRPGETDPRAIWRRLAAHWHLFRGTPSRLWLEQELHDLFGVRTRLSAATADEVYDQIAACARC